MDIGAGVAAAVFGVVHAVAGIAALGAAHAPRGSGEKGATPMGVRYAFVALAIDAVVGGVLFAISPTVVAFALMVAGLVGVVALAVVNGTWMHGAPAWRHHIVRAAVALVVVVSGALAL